MVSKTCSKCNLSKHLEDFNKDKTRKDGYRIYCRECTKADTKKHYEKNKDYYQRKARKNDAGVLTFNRDQLVKYLATHPCIDCGITDIRLLEFDHTDPTTKVAGISALFTNKTQWSKIQEEIAKCEVRCCNCHRLKTYQRMGTTWHDKYKWKYCGGTIEVGFDSRR